MRPEGDPDQNFERILRNRWQRIQGIIFRLTGDSAEAEDLALEAFWRLYRHRNGSGEPNTDGWLCRVAVNLGLNSLRARQRRRKHEQAAGWEAARAGRSGGDSSAQERFGRQQIVRLALGRMKRRDSQILILRHAGFSYAEIAALLHISPHSVGTLLARAEKDFETKYLRLEGG